MDPPATQYPVIEPPVAQSSSIESSVAQASSAELPVAQFVDVEPPVAQSGAVDPPVAQSVDEEPPMSQSGASYSKFFNLNVYIIYDSNKKKDNANAKQATLKVVLGEALGYGPALSEDIILDAGLTPTLKISKDVKLEESSIQAHSEGVKRFEDWLEDVISGTKVPEGYILMQQNKIGKDQTSADSSGTDQENRVQVLKKEVDRSVTMAELIEYNLEDVDAAIMAVRVALASGMSWDDLTRMVKEEKKSGNPVAGLIDKLHLERSSMSLTFSS